MLILTWGIDILFESYHQKQKNEFEKHPLHYASGGGDFLQNLNWPGGKWID